MTDSMLIEDAWRHYRGGRPAEALARLDEAISASPNDGRAWEMRGLLNGQLARFDDSVSDLEAASVLVPLGSASRIRLAVAYVRCGRRQLGRDLLIDEAAASPADCEASLAAASALDEIDDPYAALFTCRGIARRHPHEAEVYFRMGYFAARCGYPAHVTESLARKAIHLNPHEATYRLGLSAVLVRDGRNEEAFALVGPIGREQITAMTCTCCLHRLAALFEKFHDGARRSMCEDRIRRLDLRGAAANCRGASR